MNRVDAALTVVYLAEIRSECQLALQAEKDLLAATVDHTIMIVSDEDNLTDDERSRFEERHANFLRAQIDVQAMLSHAAAVSRILCPGNGRWKAEREKRATLLRSSIGASVQDLVVLSRGLRNDLEHYDERLYAWSQLPTVDIYQMSPSRGLRWSLDPYDNDARDLSCCYHPKKHLYTFWNDTYDLGEISAALARVHAAAGKAMFEILDNNPPLFAQQDD